MKNYLLILVPFLLFACTADRNLTGDPMEYVPEDAGLILELENPDLFFSNLRNNELISSNHSHPLYQNLLEQFSFLNYISHTQPAALAFARTDSGIGYSFIMQGSPQIDSLNSIQNRQVETLKYPGYDIKKYTLDERITYVGIIDSLTLISNSEALLIQSMEGQTLFPADTDLSRARKATSTRNPSLFINHLSGTELLQYVLPNLDLVSLTEFSNWTGVDVEITQLGIRLNGVTTAVEGTNRLLNVFQGVLPVSIELANITPVTSKGFKGIGYQDFQQLQRNLQEYRSGNIQSAENKAELTQDTLYQEEDIQPRQSNTHGNSEILTQEEILELENRQVFNSRETELLANSEEVGLIYLEDSNLLAIRPEEILGALYNFSAGSISEPFRGIELFSYTIDQHFNELLAPLFRVKDLTHFAVLDAYLVFAEDRPALEELIISYQNKSVLSDTDSYTATSNSLSNFSSLLYVRRNKALRSNLSEGVSTENRSATANLEVDQYPLSALQFIYQDNYAHLHAVLQKTNATSASGQETRQTTGIQLDAPVATKPVFFSNHRSKGKDIAVQDEDNTLYLISEDGRIYWKKQLETRIQGDIQEVDLYKNGRIQLAFATQNKLHIIDRTGKPVKPFPLEFNDEITQPLGLFDYANTRDYRFVIVQDSEIFMFDRRGQRVKGFGFSKVADELTQPLKHIRIGNRDYILAVEASGKLHILNRRGEIRVPLQETFEVSDNAWYEYEDQFISTNGAGELVKIDQNGKVSKESLGLSDGHRIVATAKTLVTLSENQLTIKGKTVNLDYGLYTPPQIFYINNKIYISVTDLQAQRVFLFDSNAELLPNFPVFGTSEIDLGNADSDSYLELSVRGDNNAVLVYEVR